MRIGGPQIQRPQWTYQSDVVRDARPKNWIEQPIDSRPIVVESPARSIIRSIARAIVRRLGLEFLGRFGRRIGRALVSLLLLTLGRPARLIGLLLQALWDLINPFRALRTAGRSHKSRGLYRPAVQGPSVRVDGPNGFLFKPRSDSDGKAVVLMPARLTGKIDHVVLKSPDGQVIEKGRFSGVANGDRAHFRFSKPGGAYPPGTIVEVRLDDGSTRQWKLTNPAQRHD